MNSEKFSFTLAISTPIVFELSDHGLDQNKTFSARIPYTKQGERFDDEEEEKITGTNDARVNGYDSSAQPEA